LYKKILNSKSMMGKGDLGQLGDNDNLTSATPVFDSGFE